MLFMSYFTENSCTESFCSSYTFSVQNLLLHCFVCVGQMFCELFCTEHPLNHTLELQRTEFDNLRGRGLCFYAATLTVSLLSLYFSLQVEVVLSASVNHLGIRGGFHLSEQLC